MSSAAIECVGVPKDYQSKEIVRALDGVSFKVGRGELSAFLVQTALEKPLSSGS